MIGNNWHVIMVSSIMVGSTSITWPYKFSRIARHQHAYICLLHSPYRHLEMVATPKLGVEDDNMYIIILTDIRYMSTGGVCV